MRCGKRFGTRREFICRRPMGHKFKHALRFTVADLITATRKK